MVIDFILLVLGIYVLVLAYPYVMASLFYLFKVVFNAAIHAISSWTYLAFDVFGFKDTIHTFSPGSRALVSFIQFIIVTVGPVASFLLVVRALHS